ncbi:radical SAM protein [Streptomyces lancefieldiae]|uniref:Radical SAM protein n=1 Tax=Streptomyces lancefieldiae TaxID=3075520 RepID=A0ABU3AJ89_9ACTN|nr:radical SAM protein [Streptomyces sp. DSM 40712]MDT0610236.1 radical SAM protein [Streptomyces sp. DSM 40712]
MSTSTTADPPPETAGSGGEASDATGIRSLHGWQRKLIAEHDRPALRTHGTTVTGVNAGERDVTIRVHEGRTWIYKVWQGDRGRATHHLYTPVTGRIHAIGRDEAELLQAADWSAAPATAISRLTALVMPFEEPGWRLPELPADARVDTPRVRVLMLNPTEQCNIRCTYCYYGGAYTDTRPHRTASPRADMVKAAIDLFVTGEEKLDDAPRAVYFFGGEPLLAFDELKKAVLALEERKREVGARLENLVLQVNTNGMLLTPEIVDFLVEYDIYLNISIDGPNHDRYRVDRRGKGTHDRVRERTDWLAENWPEYFSSRVALICVLSAPLDAAALYRYFSAWPTAHRALAWDFDLILPGGEQSYADFERVFAEQRRVWDLFVRSHHQSHAEREQSGRYHFAFSHGFLHRSFHRVLNQPEREGGARLGHLLGTQLIPGNEYLVLGADGTLYSSYEYQSPEFAVGHTDRGVDPVAGVEQLAMFRDSVQAGSCTTCWAAPLCTVTVPEAPFRRSDSADTVREKVTAKRARCMSERENLQQALRARVDIEQEYGDEALDGHRADWSRQRMEVARVDPFYA